MPAVLIATADAVLLDVLLRLAAAADVESVVASDLDRVRAGWSGAPLVCVGEDLAGALAGADPPRRSGVVLVAGGERGAAIYRQAVEIGAQDIATLPDAEPWLVDRMAVAADPQAGAATTVSVVGGRGGAGASVVAAALAGVAVRAGLRTFLVDGDRLGGGIDLVLGKEGAPGARWPDFAERRGRLSCSALRDALPGTDRLAVLSWGRGDTSPIPAAAMRSVLQAAARGSDLVVVDLPRHLDEAGVEALLATDVVLLVVPAEVRATVAADQVATAVRRYVGDIRVVVRRPAPGGLSAEVIAKSLGLPLAGSVSADRRLAAALEGTDPSVLARGGPLAGFCARFLAGLGLLPGRAAA
jgi:secretion/DNA translocation related CpaE-like protein